MKLNYAIVDDEHEARELIRGLVDRFYPEFTLLGEGESVEEAALLTENEHLHLLFLDIQLYDRNVFEIADKLTTCKAKIIFITAYDHFALNAFRVHAQGYILKPITSFEFNETVDKALRSATEDALKQQHQVIRELGQLRERKLLIHNQKGIQVVPLEQIIRLEADNNYTTFYLTDHKKIVSAKTLKDYDLILQSFDFLRAHQSHLINLHHIVSYLNRDGGRLSMSDGTTVPVSQRKRMDVLNALSGRML